MKKRRALALVAASLALVAPASALSPTPTPRAWQIVTFGTNAPQWNEILHVTEIRMGCNLVPETCVARAAAPT